MNVRRLQRVHDLVTSMETAEAVKDQAGIVTEEESKSEGEKENQKAPKKQGTSYAERLSRENTQSKNLLRLLDLRLSGESASHDLTTKVVEQLLDEHGRERLGKVLHRLGKRINYRWQLKEAFEAKKRTSQVKVFILQDTAEV